MRRRDELLDASDEHYVADFVNGKRRVVRVRGSGVFDTLADLDGAIMALQRNGSGVQIVGLRDNISQPCEVEMGCAYRHVELILAVDGSPVAMEVELEMACMIRVKHRGRFEAEARRVRARFDQLGREFDEMAEECDCTRIAIADVEPNVEPGQLPRATSTQVATLPTVIDPKVKSAQVVAVSREIRCPVSGLLLGRIPTRNNSIKPAVAFEADEPDSAHLSGRSISGRYSSGRLSSGRLSSGRFSSGRHSSGCSMSDMTMERIPLPSQNALTSIADAEVLTKELRASFIEARLAHDTARAKSKSTDALELDADLPPASAVQTAVAAGVAALPAANAGSPAGIPPPPAHITEALSPQRAKKLQLGLWLRKAKLELESANEDRGKAMSQADAALRASPAEQAGSSPGLVEFYATQLREVAEAVQAKEKRVAELTAAVAAL